MFKKIRLLSAVCITIASILLIFFIGGNEKGKAKEESNPENEVSSAITAYQNMDASSRQQMIASMTGNGNMSPPDLSQMDIETAIMIVQQKRTELLDQQLMDQVSAIQARNDELFQMTKMHDNLLLAKSNSQQFDIFVSALYANGKLTKEDLIQMENARAEYERMLELKRLHQTGGKSNLKFDGELNNFVTQSLTYGEVNVLINKIKEKIDSLNSTQQMEMLRLQSLINKKNESYEIMTSVIKKMMKDRDTIIMNAR